MYLFAALAVYCRSGLVGVATGHDEIKFSSKAGGSVRSISFMHTERLVPVEEPDDGSVGVPQPPQTQISNMQPTEGVREAQNSSDKNVSDSTEADENPEVFS